MLAYRPLRGGSAIYNHKAEEYATLGFLARRKDAPPNDPDRWMVTAFHSIQGQINRAVADGEDIFQPFGDRPGDVVARIDLARCNQALDVAACRVMAEIETTNEILGIGVPSPPKPAYVGLRVMKSGLLTGVTEGIVAEVHDDRLIITPVGNYPDDYMLTGRGDSGALWVDVESRSAVALHIQGDLQGPEKAIAVPIQLALDTADLECIA